MFNSNTIFPIVKDIEREDMRRLSLLLLSSIFLLASPMTTDFAQEGNEYLAFAEKMPEPIGGLSAIYQKIKYPDIAKRAGVEGKVYLLAFINEIGDVDDVKIIKGLGAGCDEAAIKAVKSTKFNPGVSAGKTAKIKLSLQVHFKLS